MMKFNSAVLYGLSVIDSSVAHYKSEAKLGITDGEALACLMWAYAASPTSDPEARVHLMVAAAVRLATLGPDAHKDFLSRISELG